MEQTTEISRSVVACLRCRKQKLKCGGPGKIPCQRCRVSKSDCVFVPPKAVQQKPASQSDSEGRISLLEQRLDLVESQLRAEIQELRSKCSPTLLNSPENRQQQQGETTSPPELPIDNVVEPSKMRFSELEWGDFFAFFMDHCRTVVSVVDDQLFSPSAEIRQHPLMSTVICTIASRAIKPDRYSQLVTEVDRLIATTFQGPTPDLLSLYAILLFALWTGRIRLLGYVASIAGEMKLHEAALQLGEEYTEHTESLVTRARAWFTLCSVDLQINISRPYVINRMKSYLPYAKNLVTSPHRHLVDDRICGYIDGLTITGNVKGQLQESQLKFRPFPQEVSDYLISNDEEIDGWFHQVNNNTNPLYQSFPEKQDRNRFMVPFAFMKLYINGLAMHGVESAEELISDPSRIGFIQRALHSASLLIQTQFESKAFRQAFRYTMDYNGIPTYYAISFILKAIPIAHGFVDCKRLLVRLQQAAQMFEQAGAIEAANEIRRDGDRVAALTQTVLSPEVYENPIADTQLPILFDIPSIFDEMAWDEEFPALGTLPFEEAFPQRLS